MALARQQLRANHGRCGQDWNLSPQYVSCISSGGNRAVHRGFSCSQLNNCSVSNLGDVNVDNAVNGSVLVYGSATGVWSAGNACDIIAACDIDQLRNVDVAQPMNGEILTFNSTNQAWENTNPTCTTCCFDPSIGQASYSLVVARIFYGCMIPWPSDLFAMEGGFYIDGIAGYEGDCYIPINAFTSPTNLFGIPDASPCENTVFVVEQGSGDFTLTGEGLPAGIIATYDGYSPLEYYMAYHVTIGAPDGLLTVLNSDFEGNIIFYVNGSPIDTRHIIGTVTNSNREYVFAGTFYLSPLNTNDTIAIYWETTKDPLDTSISLLSVVYEGLATV